MKEHKTNRSLMSGGSAGNGSGQALGFVEVIAVERPLRDTEEANFAASEVNNVLACVEYGLELSASHPIDSEAVDKGLRIILESCRLVSLRVEQFLAIQLEREECGAMLERQRQRND